MCQLFSGRVNPFVGSYAGTATLGISTPDTLVIAPGSNDTSINIVSRTSLVTMAFNGTTNGNNLTIPQQSVSISGVSTQFFGSGNLSGNSLTVSWTRPVLGVNVTTVFIGTKE